jgi:site-specific recombinase
MFTRLRQILYLRVSTMSPVTQSDATSRPVPGTPDPLDGPGFGQRYAPNAPAHPQILELHAALSGIDPTTSVLARSEQLARLSRWVRSSKKLPALDEQSIHTTSRTRLRLLLRVLREHVPFRQAVSDTIASLIAQTDATHLFAEVGVPNVRGLMAETTDRLSRRLLPRPRDDDNFLHILEDLFPSKKDPGWLVDLPRELVDETLSVLTGGKDIWSRLREAMIGAVQLLSTRISSLGLNEELRARSRKVPISSSAFFVLPRTCDAWVTALQAGGAGRDEAAAITEDIIACRVDLKFIHESLEQSGVSVDVVYRIEVIERSLERLALLLPLASSTPEPGRRKLAHDAMVILIKAGFRDLSIRDLLSQNMRLLGRKIIERSGSTGEHYITSSRKEYWRMLASAAGGGLLTVITAVMKIVISASKQAPFFDGALAGLNYSLSFITMQFCHFTLATKQPSMTAAALARSIHEVHDGSGSGETEASPDLDDLVTLIARISRSQLAAAMGNVTFVAIGALLFDLVFKGLTGHHFLDAAKAEYVLESIHPTKSATIWYAALTGVVLWVSSVAAGWVENWAVYRRLPEAIAQHRAGRWLGRDRMERLSRAFAKNISGVGGSVSLGFLLGMTPVMGRFFGFPLDVRHVTLSTGTLTLAAASLGPDVLGGAPFLGACLGIAIIFVLNLGVSFTLALAVALRAKGVSGRVWLTLFVAVLKRFVRRPLDFIFPPRQPRELKPPD